MTKAPPLDIYPPLLNTPCPWASTRADLLALWECTSTGAITTRTSLPDGFAHDDTVHQHTFFDAADSRRHGPRDDENDMHGSLNTFGYSPYTLSYYIDAIKSLPGFGSSINSKKENRERKNNDGNGNSKWVIVSVTGTPNDVVRSYSMLCDLAAEFPRAPRVAMEVNLSCPNIFGAPPPAYTEEGLVAYLGALRCVAVGNDGEDSIIDGAIRPRPPRLPIGIKTPPYTYVGQFEAFVRGLSREESAGVVDFVVATNTLGGCLVLGSNGVEQEGPVLPGEGIGGMAARDWATSS